MSVSMDLVDSDFWASPKPTRRPVIHTLNLASPRSGGSPSPAAFVHEAVRPAAVPDILLVLRRSLSSALAAITMQLSHRSKEH